MSSYTIDLSVPIFQQEYRQALKKFPPIKSNLSEVFGKLETIPELGDAIPGFARALWKVRVGVKGHFGKRGGYRLIYHLDLDRAVITPIALYFKPDTPDLPAHEVTKRFLEVAKAIAAALPNPLPSPAKPTN